VFTCVEDGVGNSILPRLAAQRAERWAKVVHKKISGVDLRQKLLVAVAEDRRTEPVETFVSWLRSAPASLTARTIAAG
jgi:DNA-binding transcriptional LysR family regulator